MLGENTNTSGKAAPGADADWACVIKVGFVDCVVFSPVMRSAGMPSWNRYARYAP